MVDIINKINNKVNRLTTVSNRVDSSKVNVNSKFNDLPSAQTVVEQEKVEPSPTKSTIGLLGFESDSGNLVDRGIKGHVQLLSDLEAKAFKDVHGTIEVPHQTSQGVIQHKTVEIPAEMTKTLEQRKIATLAKAQKQQFQILMDKLTGKNGIAIQKASTDEFVNGFTSKDNKQTIKSASGLRLFVDGLNETINERIGTFRNKKVQAKAKTANKISETKDLGPASKPTPTNNLGIDLSRVA